MKKMMIIMVLLLMPMAVAWPPSSGDVLTVSILEELYNFTISSPGVHVAGGHLDMDIYNLSVDDIFDPYPTDGHNIRIWNDVGLTGHSIWNIDTISAKEITAPVGVTHINFSKNLNAQAQICLGGECRATWGAGGSGGYFDDSGYSKGNAMINTTEGKIWLKVDQANKASNIELFSRGNDSYIDFHSQWTEGEGQRTNNDWDARIWYHNDLDLTNPEIDGLGFYVSGGSYPVPVPNMFISNETGFVGINTIDPQSQLHVVDNDNDGIELESPRLYLTGMGDGTDMFWVMNGPIEYEPPGQPANIDGDNILGWKSDTLMDEREIWMLGSNLSLGYWDGFRTDLLVSGTMNVKKNMAIGSSADPFRELTITKPSKGAYLRLEGRSANIELVDLDEPGDDFYIQSNFDPDGMGSLEFGKTEEDGIGRGALMEIQYNGYVGIGTQNPSSMLHVTGTITEDSDERLKEDVAEIPDALDKIQQIRGVTFNWKNATEYNNMSQLGVIAQEVEEVFPEAVRTNFVGYKSVSYGRLVAPLIEAVKEQQEQIEDQELKIQAQEKAIQSQDQEIRELKARLLDIEEKLKE